MRYILNGDILWKCTRCADLFCYYCYEPRDGHLCFDDDWIIGKGYDNITGVGDFFQYLGPKNEKPPNWHEICSKVLRGDYDSEDEEENISLNLLGWIDESDDSY